MSDLWQLLLRDRLRLTIFGSNADELQQLVLCIVLMLASSVAIPTVDILFTMLAPHLLKRLAFVRQAVASIELQQLRIAKKHALDFCAQPEKRVLSR